MFEYYVDYIIYEDTKDSAFRNLSKEDYDELIVLLDEFHKAKFFYIDHCEDEQFKCANKHYVKCLKAYKKISHIFLTEEVEQDWGFINYVRECVEEYEKMNKREHLTVDNNKEKKKKYDDDDGYDWAEIEVEHNIRVLEEESGIKREASKKNKKRGNGRKEKKGKKYAEVPDIDIWDMFH